jgi:biotin-(acetyl-CoA carboxylase) ligase
MPLFEEIVEAAQSGNKEALKTIKRRNLTLDVFNGLSTPIEQLAFEGNHTAVELLIQLGASINDAVSGYARGGDINEALVTRLLGQGLIESVLLLAQHKAAM